MKNRPTCWTLCALAAATLTACGGGGGGGGSSTTPPPPVDTSNHLVGTAAYGAPMGQAQVTIADATGKSVTVTAGADGAYNADITGFKAPLLVTATVGSGDAARTYHALVGTLTGGSSPTGGVTPGTTRHANVTPITEAVAALASSDGASPAEFSDTETLKALDTARLQQAAAALKTALHDVLAQLGDADFDPLTSTFTADRSSVGDKLLDFVKVEVGTDGVTLRNAWVPVASADAGASGSAVVTLKDPAATPAVLAAPTVTDSAAVFDPWVAELNACLALAPAARVSVDAQGEPAAFLGACAQVSGFAAGYKHNGYSLLQYWGKELHDWIPAGATVRAPEVLAFLDEANGDRRAIVRLSFDSPKGSGSYIETARKLPAGWAVEGNQRQYDAGLSVRLTRISDLSTNPLVPAIGPDAGMNVGWLDAYTSRIHFGFNQSGPNGSDVYAVRVKGPGLPASGIVLARSATCGMNVALAFYSNNGTLPTAPTPGTTFPLPTNSGGNHWTFKAVARGSRYAGSDFFNDWRGLSGPASSVSVPVAFAPGIDVTTLPPLAKYTYEVFKAGVNGVADTFSVRAVVRPAAPETGNRHAWAEFDAATLSLLDPSGPKAGELTSATLNWTVAAGGPPVTSAWVYGNGFDGNSAFRRSYFEGGRLPALGDTSVTIAPQTLRDGNGNACSYLKLPAMTATAGYREFGARQPIVEGLVLHQIVQHYGRPAP